MATEKRRMKRGGRGGGSRVRPGLILLLHEPEQLTGAQQARLPAGFSGRRRRPRVFPQCLVERSKRASQSGSLVFYFPLVKTTGVLPWWRSG